MERLNGIAVMVDGNLQCVGDLLENVIDEKIKDKVQEELDYSKDEIKDEVKDELKDELKYDLNGIGELKSLRGAIADLKTRQSNLEYVIRSFAGTIKDLLDK